MPGRMITAALRQTKPLRPWRKCLGTLCHLIFFTSPIGPAAYLFLYIYNISFQIFPSVTTGRVVLAVLTLGYWSLVYAELKRFAQENVPTLFTLFFLLVYSLLLYAVSGFLDNTQFSRSLNFLLYVIVGSIVFSAILRHDLRRFAAGFAGATLIQACFIALSYVSADYRLWLSGLVVQGGNIPLISATQVPGFSNSSGAALSVFQGIGIFTALYCSKSSTRSPASLFWFMASLVIAASTVVTGRTGLMLAVLFVGAFLLVGRLKQRLALIGLGAVMAIVALFAADAVLSLLTEANPQAQNLGAWAFEIFQRGADASSWQDLLSQPIPSLTFDRLFGTGLVAAQNGVGNESGNDSGYIQTYFALGLIMALVFYTTVALLLGKYVWRSHDRFLFAVLLGLLFVVEIKEPFIYKYIYPFLILTLAYLSSHEISAPPNLTIASDIPL